MVSDVLDAVGPDTVSAIGEDGISRAKLDQADLGDAERQARMNGKPGCQTETPGGFNDRFATALSRSPSGA